MIRCDYCRQLNDKEEVSYCQFCGAALPQEPAEEYYPGYNMYPLPGGGICASTNIDDTMVEWRP